MKQFRNNGAIGALLDEYEKAILELIEVLDGLSAKNLTTIVDPETNDPDCNSIQTILSHVIRSGYWYVLEIRTFLGETVDFPERKTLNSSVEYQLELARMFQFNEKLFADYPNLNIEETESDKKIKVRWGQVYDIEQLLEHAIVHILRHRRQVERFLIKIR